MMKPRSIYKTSKLIGIAVLCALIATLAAIKLGRKHRYDHIAEVHSPIVPFYEAQEAYEKSLRDAELMHSTAPPE